GGDRVAYVECPPASFTGPLDSVSLDGSGRVQLNPPGSTVKPGVFRNLLSPDRTDIVFPSIAGGQTSILRAALDGSPAPVTLVDPANRAADSLQVLGDTAAGTFS